MDGLVPVPVRTLGGENGECVDCFNLDIEGAVGNGGCDASDTGSTKGTKGITTTTTTTTTSVGGDSDGDSGTGNEELYRTLFLRDVRRARTIF